MLCVHCVTGAFHDLVGNQTGSGIGEVSIVKLQAPVAESAMGAAVIGCSHET